MRKKLHIFGKDDEKLLNENKRAKRLLRNQKLKCGLSKWKETFWNFIKRNEP